MWSAMCKPTESNWRCDGFILEWVSVFGGYFQWVLCCDRYSSFLLISLLIKILFNKIIPFLQISMFKLHVRALCGVARGMNFRLSAIRGGGIFDPNWGPISDAREPTQGLWEPVEKMCDKWPLFERGPASVSGMGSRIPSPAEAHEHQAQSNP